MKYLILILILIMSSCTSTPKQTLISHGKSIAFDSVQTTFDTIQLGRVREGEILMGTFAVRNNSPKPIVIANIITGCGCTTTKYDPKPIMSAQERTIEFTFDTKGRQGWQLKSIDVLTTDNTMARIYLEAQIH